MEELLEFPCQYTFKAVGVSGEQFSKQIVDSVRRHAMVSQDAIRTRPSGKGNYQAVSVIVYLENYQQLKDIYAGMHQVTGLKMLL